MTSLRKIICAMLVALGAGTVSPSAMAVTQCTGTVAQLWAGDGGSMLGVLNTGISFVLSPSDPNFKSVYALALTALVTQKTVIVRYVGDGISCNTPANRTDVVGVYINS